MDPFDKPWLKLAAVASSKPAAPKGRVTSARVKGSLLIIIHDIDEFSMCSQYSLLFLRMTAYAIARICHGNSVCLSVTRVDQSKTVEARIMQFSPGSSPIPLVFWG